MLLTLAFLLSAVLVPGSQEPGLFEEQAADQDDPGSVPEFREFSELSGRTVSMLTGAPFEELVRSFVPDVGRFTYYASMADMLLALKSGKTDAILNNNAVAALAVNKNSDLALFPHSLQDGVFGYAFAKGDPALVSEVLSVIRDLAKSRLTMLIVTHEMRLARQISDRIFFLDEGGIYEEGTPEQIFEHPKREGTRQFIFRVNRWEYDLMYESRDLPGMLGGLEAFCSRQLMDRKAERNTVLAAEELALSRILPALDRQKKGGVKLILSSEEVGGARQLQIDCSLLPDGKAALSEDRDEISSSILRAILRRLPEKEQDGTLCYEIL